MCKGQCHQMWCAGAVQQPGCPPHNTTRGAEQRASHLCCPLFPEVAFCHIRAARCSLYFPPLRFYFLLASFSVCGLQLEGGIVSCREDGLDWKERRENIGGPQKSGTHSAGFLEQSSSRLWLGCKDWPCSKRKFLKRRTDGLGVILYWSVCLCACFFFSPSSFSLLPPFFSSFMLKWQPQHKVLRLQRSSIIIPWDL